MQDLLATISERLSSRQYLNETSVREGIVVPVLRKLGWDTFDPGQVQPEYSVDRGRVDYALFHSSRQPAVFIEVKGVGRALDGDEQLFAYCFKQGVPLAVLTDGQSWNFYLPGGLGSIDQRRIYGLHLDERSPEEAETALIRYLSRERICSGESFSAARTDHERAINQREAKATLPAAWSELIGEQNEALLELVAEKVEALCGYRPSEPTVLEFLRSLGTSPRQRTDGKSQAKSSPALAGSSPTKDRSVEYAIKGERRSAPNASRALVDILRTIIDGDVSRLPELSEKVRGRTRCAIARSPEEINPSRPDLARGEEIAPGWLVGLNIDNREKQMIIEAACETYGLVMPGDIDVRLPNS